ncbi:MAG: ATP-binding protein, partial [Acidaminococcaceae bacterium]|nr:ATP-binding protein [Acidaminococcaceae bacterium]
NVMAIVSQELVISMLRKYNIWWRNPGLIGEESKPQKRQAFFKAMEIITHSSVRRFAVLSGARRVGKTTIMYQMIEQLLADGVSARNILYVSFDNPIIKLVNIEAVLDIYETLYPTTGTRYIFFDEIQYAEEWELWLKVIYDTRKGIRVTATGSASPVLEKGTADSGTGRWSVLKIPTLSFYEYCRLLNLEEPDFPQGLRLTDFAEMAFAEMGDLMSRFSPFVNHFNRYLAIGGFPELVLADDDHYAQRMLREDVVDKVIKRDILTLFKIRNPLLMEKLFLYLCINSTGIFNATSAAKELENTSVFTIESYIDALEKSNLIYLAEPMLVGSKGSLKGKPKIFIADAAIRNAVLMVDDVLADEAELGAMVETTVYKHIVSFYQGSMAHIGYYREAADNQKEVDVVIELPHKQILCEVKYRNNSHIAQKDALIKLCSEKDNQVKNAFLITKDLGDFGKTQHETVIPVMRIPAIAFLYFLGKSESGQHL